MLIDDDDDDDEDDEVDEYDLSPDEDELDLDLLDADEESDDLDNLEDPRITEVDSDDGAAPKLVPTKGKKKRTADDLEDLATLDQLIAQDNKKPKTEANGEVPLSKKQQKKLKKTNGDAAVVESKKEPKESQAATKADKKVQFAKNLEQGPTPSTQDKHTNNSTGTLGVKEVQGVTIDDRKLGKGSTAKSGNTVSMRYIGKLDNGKVFDCEFDR
jgi:FK506-binding nuclear protein